MVHERSMECQRTEPVSAPGSYQQEGLWFSEQLSRHDGLLNLCVPLRLRGALDTHALRSAFDTLAHRHEILRTTFELAGDTLRQHIQPPAPVDFAVTEAADLARARDAGLRESMRRFDTAHDRLLRVRLLRVAEDDHVLVIAMHHLVCDLWSVDVLLRDLGELYDACATGRAARLPALERQYRHFSADQRQRLAGEHLDDLTGYWTETLAGAPWTLDIPVERTGPVRRFSVGGAISTTLPEPLVHDLEQLAKQERVTVFTVVLAAVRMLLWQHSEQTDILVGTPMGARERAEDEALIGLFVNMLVLRNEVNPDLGFRGLLRSEFFADLEAFEHRELPYRTLVETVLPERDTASAPLFPVAVSFGARDDRHPDWRDLRVEDFPLGETVSQFDLSVAGHRVPDGAQFVWSFNDAVYDTATVARLSERLEPLLRAVLSEPDRPIRQLRALSPADLRQLADGRLSSRRPEPAHTDVVAMVAAQAAAHPDAPAVRQATTVLDYAGLMAAVDRVAGRLQAMALPPETRVGLLLRRTPHLPGVLLAVLRAGLAFVPLDIEAPVARTAGVLADCGARVLVHDSGLDVPEGPWRSVETSALLADGGPLPTGAPAVQHPDRLGYVLYTSGSTGTPKGVGVGCGALANCLEATRSLLGSRPGQRWLAVSRTAFDISLLELLTPLVSGCEVVVTTDEQGRDAVALRGLLESLEPDLVQATPAMWGMLEDAGWLGHRGLTVHTGGDVVPPALAERLISRTKDFWHTYGPTEATLYCVATQLSDVSGMRVLPIGVPIPGAEVCVLDEFHNPVPPGVVGELCVAGAGLARGYLGRPGHTADRFVPHPSPARPGERLYRTGDRAILRFDGRLELRGRVDHQVKLRGFRIELGEIEAVLGTHPAVEQAAVLLVGDTPESERLVGFLVLTGDSRDRPDENGTLAGIRAHAKGSLPHYMLPASYRIVDRMPMTVNAKVDRRQLAALDVPSAPADDVHKERWTALEQVVVEIWSDLLDPPRIGRDDDFFGLGGNSLLAVRTLERIREHTGVRLSPWVLFEAPTVAELAERIAEERPVPGQDGSLGALLPLRPGDGRPPLFCVHPGAGIGWMYASLLDPLGPDRPVYALQADGLLDPESAPSTVTQMAARYVDRIRTVQPAGPYHLAGWSFGALVAQAMAVRLRELGHDVALLALLDGYPVAPDVVARWENADDDAYDAPVDLSELLDSLGYPPEAAPRKPLSEADFIELARTGDGPLAGLDAATISALGRAFVRHAYLAIRHTPAPFDGRAVVFAAVPATGSVPGPRSWRPHVLGGIESHTIPCTHGTMLTPSAATAVGAVIATKLTD